ncbi:MAG: DUF445 domain-containing protein [Gemmatimonadaceae bacterium]
MTTPLPLAPMPDEAGRQARLDRMKRIATAMLLVAATVYGVTRALESRHPWLGALRAMAEASMIGGLADWFAVTALFRHPLGIPIPHTAIVRAKKDAIGRSLGGFVQRNFLSREVLGARLRALRIAEHAARWLSRPENAHAIARHAGAALASGAALLRDDDVQALLGETVARRVRKTEVAPILGKALSLVTLNDRHQELLDAALALTAKVVAENRGYIRERIEQETPWWVPGVVDDRIHAKVVGAIETTLRDVESNPGHPLRLRFDAALRDFIERLQTSPDVIARAEEIKGQVLDADVVRRFTSSLWTDVKSAIVRYGERAEDATPGTLERALTTFGDAVLADPALVARLDGWIVDATLDVVERYRGEVEKLIAQTVAAWDPDATSHRIELAIGRDLQFIRINGTLVGGLAGLAIYLLSRLL